MSAVSRPGYVVNIPYKVNSDDEGSSSSDEEVDDFFYDEKVFENPEKYFRLLPEPKNTKSPWPRGNLSPDMSPNKTPVYKSTRVENIVNLLSEQARHCNYLSLCIGFNKMRSLSKRRNNCLARHLNANISSSILVKKIAFFWDGVWQHWSVSKGWHQVDYQFARGFYVQLKRRSPERAAQFMHTVEKVRNHMVPYRKIRDRIKNSKATKKLIKDSRSKGAPDTYLVFMDSDVLKLGCGENKSFKVLNKNYSKHPFTVGTTGYRIIEPDNLALEVAVEADMTVRQATSIYFKLGVYYPEPFSAIKVPQGQDTLPENIADSNDKKYISPKELPRLIEKVIDRRKIDPQKEMVFDFRGAVCIETPDRFKREFNCQPRRMYSLIIWGLNDLKKMRGLSQTHNNPLKWARYLLPSLKIRQHVKVGSYLLFDQGAIKQFVTSLLARLFNTFDPLYIAEQQSSQTGAPFQKVFIEILKNKNKNYQVSKQNDKPTDEKSKGEKQQAKDLIWKELAKIDSLPNLCKTIDFFLTENSSSKCLNAAKESQKHLIQLYKSRLCLNYETLVQASLSDLLNLNCRPQPEAYKKITQDAHFNKETTIRDLEGLVYKDYYDIDPMRMAAIAGNIRFIEWWKNRKFPFHIKDSYGRTPLDFALQHCRDNGVNRKLLTLVCDQNYVDTAQKSTCSILDDFSDQAKALTILIEKHGPKVIKTFDKELFAHALRSENESLYMALFNCIDGTLDLSNTELDQDNVDLILSRIIKTAPNLQKLILSNCKLSGVEHISNALPKTGIQTIDLSGNEFCREVILLIDILDRTVLTHLNLAGTSLSYDDANALGNALPSSPLLDLDISGNDIESNGIISIRDSLEHSKLKRLAISTSQASRYDLLNSLAAIASFYDYDGEVIQQYGRVKIELID